MSLCSNTNQVVKTAKLFITSSVAQKQFYFITNIRHRPNITTETAVSSLDQETLTSTSVGIHTTGDTVHALRTKNTRVCM
jgi:hypothetical protein